MRIGVVGLGLIGGSLARSIRAHSSHAVLGWDRAPEVVSAAIADGTLNGELSGGDPIGCDMVLVALYPAACVEYVRRWADCFSPGAWVIDCAGVKRIVCDTLFPLAENRPWRFVGGHPMAGREHSGYAAARDNLFERAAMLLAPPKGFSEANGRALRDFFMEIGFRDVRFTTPEEHDRMIGYTSQLAHVLSSAYVKNPLSADNRDFTGGSFQDLTRVARLNETMWTELFLDNADDLLASLDDLLTRLNEYHDALIHRDAEALKALLREGRLCKEAIEPGKIAKEERA